MTKLYMLYEAVDTRDNKPMLWLIDVKADRVALFHTKTAVSRIKHRIAVHPESIVWGSSAVLEFCNTTGLRHLHAQWEFSS